jgi:effector-binding domain-containing protein
MSYAVSVVAVTEHPVAAVRARIPQSQIAGSFRPLLDKVWAFIRAEHGLWAGGHNVFLYRGKDEPAADGKMSIDFGVQVTRTFTGRGEVICTATPAGRAATTVHVGPYHGLMDAHAAVQAWCRVHGHTLAGIDWEIYGDPSPDPAKTETQVFYLLQ